MYGREELEATLARITRGDFDIAGQVHLDQMLSGFNLNYMIDQSLFIADRVLVQVPVNKKTNGYVVWNQPDLMRRYDTKRAELTQANKVAVRVGSATYQCVGYGLKDGISVEEEVNMDDVFTSANGEQGRVQRITNFLLIDKEIRVASLLTQTANVGSSAAVASAWSDPVSGHSDPVSDINTALDNIRYSCGYRPNGMVIGGGPWRALRRHQDIIGKALNPNYIGFGNYPMAADVAKLFELDELLIGDSQLHTGAPIPASGTSLSLARPWGNNCLLYFKPPGAPSLEQPNPFVSFNWSDPRLGAWNVVRHPFDSKIKGQELEIDYWSDERVIAKPLTFLLTGCSSKA